MINIYVDANADLTLERLLLSKGQFGSQFVDAGEIKEIQGKLNPDGVNAAQPLASGYRLTTNDKKNVVQIRINGFAFSQLAPYLGWDAISNEARRHWKTYWELARPRVVNGLSLRFVNRIELPPGEIDLELYFQTYPKLPENLDSGITDFVMSVEIPQEATGATLRLKQAFLPVSADAESASVILDIDLALPVTERHLSESEIWAAFDKLRDEVNAVFEACITNSTRELIS